MKKFEKFTGVAAPFRIINIDTDRIIPKQFLKTIYKSGLGKSLFFEMRYNKDGTLNPDFVLNKPEYSNTEIIVAYDNFGCGSSREHAPWALVDYGIRAVISTSFADIFYNNSSKNGLLLIKLSEAEVEEIMEFAEKNRKITVDLESESISVENGKTYKFSNIDLFKKHCLLKGLDDVGLTLKKKDFIEKFEETQKVLCPWLWN